MPIPNRTAASALGALNTNMPAIARVASPIFFSIFNLHPIRRRHASGDCKGLSTYQRVRDIKVGESRHSTSVVSGLPPQTADESQSGELPNNLRNGR